MYMNSASDYDCYLVAVCLHKYDAEMKILILFKMYFTFCPQFLFFLHWLIRTTH